MSVSLFALMLALSAKPKPKPKKPPAAASRRVSTRKKRVPLDAQGQVSSVTADAAFLDRGSADGLAPGQSLTFTRAGKPGGKCIVDAVADHFARCAGTGLKPGDRFAVARAFTAPPRAPAPLPSESELQRRAAALEATEWRLRTFDTAASLAAGVTRVEALFSHTTFTNPNSTQGPFGVQRFDAAVYDVEVWKGLRVSADVTVLNFGAQPLVTRSYYQQTPVLLVRQLELGFRRADVPLSGSLGRIWLRGAPGVTVLDGAQGAFKLSEGLELGAYGGLLPNAAYLSLDTSQWAVGAFGRARFSLGTGAASTVAQLGLRAGWSQRDLLGGRAEVGLAASLWKSSGFEGHLAVELGIGQSQAPALLDAARLDLGWRPSEKVRFSGGVRYRGLPLSGLVEVGTVSPGQRALHADLSGSVELQRGVLLGINGGLASDFLSGLWQARFGPELVLPHLFGLPMGASAGYFEELGWLRGRHAFFQVNVAPLGLFRLLSRVSWFHQQGVLNSEGIESQELGGSFALEVTPWRFVNARVLVMGRLPLAAERVPLGSIGFQLGGAF